MRFGAITLPNEPWDTLADRWRRAERPVNAHVGVDLDVDGFFDLLVERIGRLG